MICNNLNDFFSINKIIIKNILNNALIISFFYD